jgi:ubiquitin C-terminal hydrolase
VAYPQSFCFKKEYLTKDLADKEKNGYQNSSTEKPVLRNHTYQLYAFIIHAGSSSGAGHYYAICRHNEVWLKFDDHVVTEIKTDDILQKELRKAYILFYYRRWNYPIT